MRFADFKIGMRFGLLFATMLLLSWWALALRCLAD